MPQRDHALFRAQVDAVVVVLVLPELAFADSHSAHLLLAADRRSRRLGSRASVTFTRPRVTEVHTKGAAAATSELQREMEARTQQDTDQAAAHLDQTHADTDQTAADVDQLTSDADQALADRDQHASDQRPGRSRLGAGPDAGDRGDRTGT